MHVAVVTTHPIQYQVPWLRMLAAREEIDLQVYFAMIPDAAEQGREFGVAFDWDSPLLGGYPYKVLENRSKAPSLTEFAGCDTPSIRHEIRHGAFDAVIVNGWVAKTCLQALLACKLSGTPCIVRGEANGLRPRSAWKRAAHALLLSQYRAYLAIGTNNRSYYLDRHVRPDRIFSTPYCVDNRHFQRGADAWKAKLGQTGLRARFGLGETSPVFLFSGKFVPKKRPGDVVEAVRRLAQAGPVDFEVLMVGDGPLGSELRAAAEGLPIRFPGFLNQSEISAAYAASDAQVLPSDSGETWGLVLNEGMACGLPALVSDQVGSAVDLVTPGVTGEVFPCGDIGTLASALQTSAREPGRMRAMGEKARQRVSSEYNFDRVLDGVLAALESIKRKPS